MLAMAVEMAGARNRIASMTGPESAPCALLLDAAEEAYIQKRGVNLVVRLNDPGSGRTAVYSPAIRPAGQLHGHVSSEEETVAALKTFLVALTENRLAFEFFDRSVESRQPNWESHFLGKHTRRWEVPVGTGMLVGVKTVSFGIGEKEKELARIWYVQGLH
jgi:hypothetical protein